MNKAYFSDNFLRILRTPGKNIMITKFGLFKAPNSESSLGETISNFTGSIGVMEGVESIWYPSENILSVTIEIPWGEYRKKLKDDNGFDVTSNNYMVAFYYKIFDDNIVRTEPGIVIYDINDSGKIASPELLYDEDGLNFYSIQFPTDTCANIIVKDHNLESKTLGISGANLLKDDKEFKNTEFTTKVSYNKCSRRKISAGNVDPIYLDDFGRKITTKKPDFFKYYTKVVLSTSSYRVSGEDDPGWNSYFISDDSSKMAISGIQYYKLYKYNKQNSKYELYSDKLYSENISTDVKLDITGTGSGNVTSDRVVTFKFDKNNLDSAVIYVSPEKTFKNEITGDLEEVKEKVGVKVSKFIKWQVWNDTVYNTTISDSIYPLFLLDSDGKSEGHYYLETTKLIGGIGDKIKNKSNVTYSNADIWNKYFTLSEEFTKTSDKDDIIQLKITIKANNKNDGNSWFPLSSEGKSELVLCTVDLGITIINFFVVQRMKPSPVSLYYTKTVSSDSNQVYGKATEPEKDSDGNYKLTLPGIQGYKSVIFTVTDNLSNEVYGNWKLKENTSKTVYQSITSNVFIENTGSNIIHKETDEPNGRGYVNTFLYPSNKKGSENKEQSLGYFTISRDKSDNSKSTEAWEDAMYCDKSNDIRVNVYLEPEKSFNSEFFVRSDTPYFEPDTTDTSTYDRVFLFSWGNYEEGSSVSGYTPAPSRYFYVFHQHDGSNFTLDSVTYPESSVIINPTKYVTPGRDIDGELSSYNTDYYRIELTPKTYNLNNYWVGGITTDKAGKFKYTQNLIPIVFKFKTKDSSGKDIKTYSVSIYCVIGVKSPEISVFTDGDIGLKEIDKISNPTYTVDNITTNYLKSGDTITNGTNYYEAYSINYKKIDSNLLLFSGDSDSFSFKHEKNLYITSDKIDNYNYWISNLSELSKEISLSNVTGELLDNPVLKDGVYNFSDGVTPTPIVIGSTREPESTGINFGKLEISRYSEEGTNTSLIKSDWKYAAYNSSSEVKTVNPEYSGINTDDIQLGTDYEPLSSSGVSLKFDYIGLYKLTVKSKKKCTLIITNKSGSENFDIDIQFFDSYFNESLGSGVRQLEIDPSKLNSGYDVYLAFSGDNFDKQVSNGYLYDTYIKVIQSENSNIIKEVPIVRSTYELGEDSTETKVSSDIVLENNEAKVEWNNNVKDIFTNVENSKENAILISRLEVRIKDVTTEKDYSNFTKCSSFAVSHKFDINSYKIDRGYINSFLEITNSETNPEKHYKSSGDFYPLRLDRSIIFKHEDDVDNIRYSAYLYYYYVPKLSINPTSIELPGSYDGGVDHTVRVTSKYLSFDLFREVETNNLKAGTEYSLVKGSSGLVESIVLRTSRESTSTEDRDNLGTYSEYVTIDKNKFLYDGSGNLRNNTDQYSDDQILEIVGKSNEVSFGLSRKGYVAPPTTYTTNVDINVTSALYPIIVADMAQDLSARSLDYNSVSDYRKNMYLDGSSVTGLTEGETIYHTIQGGIMDTNTHTIDIYNAIGAKIGSKDWSANAWSLTSNPSNLVDGNYVPSDGTIVVNINTGITTGYKYKDSISQNGSVQLFSVDETANTITLGNATKPVVINLSDIFEIDNNATYYDTCKFELTSAKYENELKYGYILADDKDLILTITATRADGNTPSNKTLNVYRVDNGNSTNVSTTTNTDTISYQFSNTIGQTSSNITFNVCNGKGDNIGVFYVQANAWSLTTNNLATGFNETYVPSVGSNTLTINTALDIIVTGATKGLKGNSIILSNSTAPVVLSTEKLYITHVSISGTRHLPIGAARTLTIKEVNDGAEIPATERQLYVYQFSEDKTNGKQIASTTNLGDSGLSFTYTAVDNEVDWFYVYNGNQTLGNTDSSNHVSYFRLPGAGDYTTYPLVTNDVASGWDEDNKMNYDYVPKSGNGSITLSIIVPAKKQLKSSLGETLSIANCTATLSGTSLTLSNATGVVTLNPDYFFEDLNTSDTETFYSKASIVFSGNLELIATKSTTVTVNATASQEPTNKVVYLLLDDSVVASSNNATISYVYTCNDTKEHKFRACVGSGNYTDIATATYQNTSWPLTTSLKGENGETYDCVSVSSDKHIKLVIPKGSKSINSADNIKKNLSGCLSYCSLSGNILEIGEAFSSVTIKDSDLYSSFVSNVEITISPSSDKPWSISGTQGIITARTNDDVDDKTLSIYEGTSLLSSDSSGLVSYSVKYYDDSTHTYNIKNGNNQIIKTFTNKANAWDLFLSPSASTDSSISSVPISGNVTINLVLPPTGYRYKSSVSVANTGVHVINTSVSPAQLTLGDATGTVTVLSTDVFESDSSSVSTYYASAFYSTSLISPSTSSIVYADKPSYRISASGVPEGGQGAKEPTNKTLILKREASSDTKSEYIETSSDGNIKKDITLNSTVEQTFTLLNGKQDKLESLKLKANVWTLILNGNGFGTSPGYVSSESGNITSIDISGITIPSGKQRLSGEISIKNVTAYINGTTLQLSKATGTVTVNASDIYSDIKTSYYTGATVSVDGSSVIGGKTNNFIITLTPEKVDNNVFQYSINSSDVWSATGPSSGSNKFTFSYEPNSGTEVVIRVRPGLTEIKDCITTTFQISSWIINSTQYYDEGTCGVGESDYATVTINNIPSGKSLNPTPIVNNATLVSSSGNIITIRTATGPVTISNLFIDSGSSTIDYYFIDVKYTGPLPDGFGRSDYLIGGNTYQLKFTGLSKAGQEATNRTLRLEVTDSNGNKFTSTYDSGVINYSLTLNTESVNVAIYNGIGTSIFDETYTPDAWELVNKSTYISGNNSYVPTGSGSSVFTIIVPSGKAVKSNISIPNCSASVSGTSLTLSDATGIVTITDSDVLENSSVGTIDTYYTSGLLKSPYSIMYAGSSYVLKGSVSYDTDEEPTNKYIHVTLGGYIVGTKLVTPTGKTTSFNINITVPKTIISGNLNLVLWSGQKLDISDDISILYIVPNKITVTNSYTSGGGGGGGSSRTGLSSNVMMARRLTLPNSVLGNFSLVPAIGVTRTYQTVIDPVSVLGYYSSSSLKHLDNPDINGIWTYKGELPKNFRYGTSTIVDNLTNYVGVFDSQNTWTTYSSYCLNIRFKSVALRAYQDKDSGFTWEDYQHGISLGTITKDNLGMIVTELYRDKEIFSYESTIGSGFQVDFKGNYQFRKNIYQKNYENVIILGYPDNNGEYQYRLFFGDGLDYVKWSPGNINGIGNKLILEVPEEAKTREIIAGSVKISDLNKIRNDSTFVNEISFEPITISGGNSTTLSLRTKLVDETPTNRIILGDKNYWNIRDFYGNMCTLVIVKKSNE